MNNRHMAYIIGSNINNCYSLVVMHLIWFWNIKLSNHLPVGVVVIGRPMHRIVSIARSYLRYVIHTYVCMYVMVLYLKLLPISAS